MITVEEAKSIIEKTVVKIDSQISIFTKDSCGYTLAEDLLSPLDLPPFNQSNVDGYAVSQPIEPNQWVVTGEIKAGDNNQIHLKPGDAARIFTGAMVPENAIAVIMQERITKTGRLIEISDSGLFKITPGDHIRKKGSQIKASEPAVKKGIRINPSSIGFISSLGINEIPVYRKPEIILIITGNELQSAGKPLQPGKVYESNSAGLSAALSMMGLEIKETIFAKDEKKAVANAVADGLTGSDLLIISGGISVGDYDFVKEILDENNTETLFYKVAQKPGKPLFFGRNKSVYIFGLPGNPGSALTCFYQYVYPCVRKLQGYNQLFLDSTRLPAASDISKKNGLAHFLKARVKKDDVQSLEGQESFKMKSFSEADAFIYLPLEKENVKAGEPVEVHLLPRF